MATYCAIAINNDEMELSDEMRAAFLSGATFRQLYGAAVCFTDMTHSVRDRVVEFPFEVVMIHLHFAILANGYTPKDVCNMSGVMDAEKLLNVYKSTLTAELMDSRQSEYFSDNFLFGAEHASD